MTTNLQVKSIITNNQSFKAFDIDGLIHPVEPVQQIVTLSIHNIEAAKVKEFSLGNEIDFSLFALFMRVDIKADDSEFMGDDTLSPTEGIAQIYLDTLQDGKIIERTVDVDLNTPNKNINLVFDSQHTFQIKSRQDINRLTFYCKPIYFLKEINIV